MSLKQDLDTINIATQKLLYDCNAVIGAYLNPVEVLAELPSRIEDVHGVGYTTGNDDGFQNGQQVGYDTGYETGYGNAEVIVLQKTNPVIEKYTAPADTVDELPAKIDEVHADGEEQGKQAERQRAYDEFWDRVQQNGSRTDYRYGFAGYAWDDTTFKPKYDMKCSYAERMFQMSQITDLKGILEAQGVTIDVKTAAKNNYLTMWLGGSKITHLPVIDCSLMPNNNAYVFGEARELVSVDKWILKSDGMQIINETTTFQNCTSLTDIVIEGKIWRSLSFQWCPLSRASLESIMAALTDTVELAQVLTLNKAAVEAAFTTEEWETLAATKPNWTITLA